jgi:DNA-binding response OmpR family regulator
MPVHRNILYVTDGVALPEVWLQALIEQSWSVVTLFSVHAVLDWRLDNTCDIMIVDVSSKLDACDIVCQLRADSVIPVLLLLEVTDNQALIEGYEAGADDCISKPIPASLFVAKVRVWLRHSWSVPISLLDNLRVGPLLLDSVRHEAVINNGPRISLTNLEFRALYVLASHTGQSLTSRALSRRIWGDAVPNDQVLVKKLIYRLRRKIEHDPTLPRYILATSGGYMFVP